MKRTQITIKDIARELGISPSTVSRALKDHPDISADTKKAVSELAAKYRYTPNSIALSLRSQKSNVIGVVIPQIVHFFFSSVISGIEEAAEEHGYNVMVCQSDESYEKEIRNVETCISSRIDGILVSMSKNTHKYDHFEKVLDDNIPLVFFDRVCPGVKADRIVVDDYYGAFNAVEHMIKGGCRRIAHLGSSKHLLIARNRLNGYIDALKKYGLPVDESIILECDSRESALERTPALFNKGLDPDGIFAINDLTASGALTAVKRLGLNVPDDVSICGFSDGLVAQVVEPPMTTVEQHGFEVGKAAAQLLIDRIEGRTTSNSITKMIKTTLVIRESTKLIRDSANV
ncbi:LacI family DNA-binding transcriptional regulator [Saccharicrinis sp. FJH54]|uniref:LacI family DNA-binding transcriptional regulator n=1 Tax=Saccharicrinis sp. FJH54 TaxID=3344665 RepID=UPI0035D4993F